MCSKLSCWDDEGKVFRAFGKGEIEILRFYKSGVSNDLIG
jgi:hypothetical protein